MKCLYMNNTDFAGPGAATAAAAGGVGSGPFSMFAAAAAAGGVHHPLQEAIMARIRPFGLTVTDLYNGMQAHKYVRRLSSVYSICICLMILICLMSIYVYCLYRSNV